MCVYGCVCLCAAFVLTNTWALISPIHPPILLLIIVRVIYKYIVRDVMGRKAWRGGEGRKRMNGCVCRLCFNQF